MANNHLIWFVVTCPCESGELQTLSQPLLFDLENHIRVITFREKKIGKITSHFVHELSSSSNGEELVMGNRRKDLKIAIVKQEDTVDNSFLIGEEVRTFQGHSSMLRGSETGGQHCCSFYFAACFYHCHYRCS